MKKRVVRESQEIILSEYGLNYSKGVVSLEKCFGRERTLERMIKLRQSKKEKLDFMIELFLQIFITGCVCHIFR